MVKILRDKQVRPHKTELQVQWDSGEISWLPLSIVKRADPHLFNEYALTAHGHWANHYRSQRRQFLTSTKHIFTSSTVLFKYGHRLPRSHKEALEIDRQLGNSLWADAIQKEMSKMEKFGVFKSTTTVPDGYLRLRCMLVFDIKQDGTRKARLVADSSNTPSYTDSYSSVIAPEHVRLALFVATLNALDHEMIDLENFYLHALTKEQAYTYLPVAYGPLGGKLLVFHKALYGMRTSGACFHEALSVVLVFMEFQPSKADPDLWLRVQDGKYEYIARYVDDLMIFAHRPKDIVTILQDMFSIHVGSNQVFLGGDITFHDGCPFTSAKTYISNTCKKIETLCDTTLTHFDSPMATDDYPESDDTTFLDSRPHSIYRFLIGAAQWIVTLGRLDILYAVSTMSHFSQHPRQGHLDRMLRGFGYLKIHSTLCIYMVPTMSSFPTTATEFVPQQWRE